MRTLTAGLVAVLLPAANVFASPHRAASQAPARPNIVCRPSGGDGAGRSGHLRADARRIDWVHDREGPAATWRLYTGPIRVDGPMTLRAKAIRYGYKASAETRMVFTK